MNRFIILLIFAIHLLVNNSYSQVTLEWVARYNGPVSNVDVPRSIATDASGNVYVTGESIRSTGTYYDFDYVTMKYNSFGVLQWVQRYNGPENGDDRSCSIAVDGYGNVYVTGFSWKSANYDFITIKYNSSGVQQWVKKYDSPESGNDLARSLALDGAGNIYVTGICVSNYKDDGITIKYSPSGSLEWVQRYDGGGNEDPVSIAVDVSGNAYVTGSVSVAGYTDYLTIKYNSSGVQEWVKTYNGIGNFTDRSTSIAVDGSGNVYVTGQSYGIGTSSDYATIKYNSSGAEDWVKRYNGPGNSFDGASAIAVDGSGNVYVTGQSDGIGTSSDYATIKYNSSGAEDWVKRYNGTGSSTDRGLSIAVDLSGNVYMTGESWGSSSNFDYITIKYNSSGIPQWIERYNGPYDSDRGSLIAVDLSGNVYVTGESFGGYGTQLDFATIKYSQRNKKLIGGISISDSFLEPELPKDYSLAQNYPNPFNPSTTIKFSLPTDENVVITVCDISGKRVSELLNQKMSSGYHEINFDGSNISSGVYFYKIITSKFTDIKKMVLVK
jgi:uncharacterized delta-60 repeat protein